MEPIVIAILLCVLFGAALIVVAVFLGKSKSEIQHLTSKLERYSKISDIEEEASSLRGRALKMKEGFEALKQKYETLLSVVGSLEEEEEMAQFGLYKAKYDLGPSERYKKILDELRDKQKDMIKNGKAAYCKTEWTVGGSKREGKKATNRTLKLALSAYNVECENLIAKAKYNNLEKIEDRLDKLRDRIQKFIEPLDCYIDMSFHALKYKELHLVHEYKEKVQEEKEEQKAIREQMREEEKARKEYEAAEKKALKEEEMYQKALKKAQAELDKAGDAEKDKLNKQLADLQAKLDEATSNKERALSMAQQTRRGHVYVISNIGSFGEHVHKIGLTRRLEPLDRVKELGDASVPFSFDVHAMIFSEDAPTLEKELHQAFNEKRVNMINHRKEFFHANLAEIERKVGELGHTIEFTRVAEAKEYRETVAAKAPTQKEETKLTDTADIEYDFDEEIKA